MPSSDVAKFLIDQYLRLCGPDDADVITRFKDIAENLEEKRTALTNTESIPWLYDLNDILCDWQLLKDHMKIGSFELRVGRLLNLTIEARLADFNKRLRDLQNSLQMLLEARDLQYRLKELLPNSMHLDRNTFYKPNLIDAHDDVSDDEHEKVLFDWLLTPPVDDFKVAGIHGTGGSGKTPLVKNVLKQKKVAHNFKCIIWACLSQLTGKQKVEIVDVKIMEYLLYRLGLDIDSLVGKAHENRDWLLEEVERRLMKSRNYILVLDGMWDCSEWFTDDFLGKMNKKGGGVVIVTSRRKTVAERICSKSKNNRLIHLNPLAYKESAAFFETRDLGK